MFCACLVAEEREAVGAVEEGGEGEGEVFAERGLKGSRRSDEVGVVEVSVEEGGGIPWLLGLERGAEE